MPEGDIVKYKYQILSGGHAERGVNMADATRGDEGSRYPKSEIMGKIRDAEEQVRQTLKAAEANREKAIAEAKREAIEVKESILEKARKSSDAAVQQAQAQLDREREGILNRAEADAARIGSVSASKIDRAKKHLLDELMRALDDKA